MCLGDTDSVWLTSSQVTHGGLISGDFFPSVDNDFTTKIVCCVDPDFLTMMQNQKFQNVPLVESKILYIK